VIAQAAEEGIGIELPLLPLRLAVGGRIVLAFKDLCGDARSNRSLLDHPRMMLLLDNDGV
jgi:hypothetical protein